MHGGPLGKNVRMMDEQAIRFENGIINVRCGRFLSAENSVRMPARDS